MPSFRPLDPIETRNREFVPQLESSGGSGPSDASNGGAFSPGDASAPECAGDPEGETWKRAYEEGRAAAQAELPWREGEELRSAAGALREAARGLAALRGSYLRTHRRALVDLALAVAEKVIARTIVAEPDALAGIVERALDLLGGARATRVCLSPHDCDVLERGLAPELARLAADHDLEIEPDPNLAPGDARVLAGATEVDARLDELLRRVREQLADEIGVEEAAE